MKNHRTQLESHWRIEAEGNWHRMDFWESSKSALDHWLLAIATHNLLEHSIAPQSGIELRNHEECRVQLWFPNSRHFPLLLLHMRFHWTFVPFPRLPFPHCHSDSPYTYILRRSKRALSDYKERQNKKESLSDTPKTGCKH